MRVTARRVSTGWTRAEIRSSDGGCVAPTMNGELRRRTATSGDEQCTSDGEQGELERGASSGRGEWRERESLTALL
jgi:hypothetical protein